MLLIDNPTVEKVLTMDDCIRTQEEAFLGLLTHDSVHRSRIDIYVPCERPDGYYRWGTMEGASKTLGVHAIRMKSDIVYWPRDEKGNWTTEEKYCSKPGLYCGLVFLLSTRTGEPLAIINEGYLQHMRVGAGAGIGVKHLSRADSHVVGMLGSGGMARTYLRAFCTVRDIREVRVYSPNPLHRQEYAAEMSKTLGIDVRAVDDPRSAVRGADIVSTCTDTMVPVLYGDWLEPGMHITNLGGYEWGADVFTRADIVIRQGVGGVALSDAQQRVEVGRGHSPIAYIAGSDEEVARIPPSNNSEQFETPRRGPSLPTFIDLMSEKVNGRTSPDQITAYIAGGYQGLQFAAAAAAVYQNAKQAGLGRELPTEWFLQDIRD
jgi:alanine dehydrogenase